MRICLEATPEAAPADRPHVQRRRAHCAPLESDAIVDRVLGKQKERAVDPGQTGRLMPEQAKFTALWKIMAKIAAAAPSPLRCVSCTLGEERWWLDITPHV
jgi:hypothetical protein